MKRSLFLTCLALSVFSACRSNNIIKYSKPDFNPIVYEVNLNDRADDLFKVRVLVDDLQADNAIYQFASTAPGAYQVMDIGRFVRSFEVFDGDGNPIPAQQISTNQWQIEDPVQVSEIRYTIAETWDTPVDSNKVYEMVGTSIEDDHVQLLGHAVFGYPTGMQSRPLKIKIDYPEKWLVGTALYHDKKGVYYADNYDHIVDSPILMGRLSKAEVKVKGSKIEIYTYSKTDKVKSKDILEHAKDILLAAAEFMGGELPVKRYTFLFHFEDLTLGAWEHSYSSNYVYKEDAFERIVATSLHDVIAHEFYHIVTPLNLHSEIIEQFNFVKPAPSQHLWLYEGLTEWAAQKMQLSAGLVDLEDYLKGITRKIRVSGHFPKALSLKELALTAFEKSGQKNYPNIYMKGAVIAGLLDIRLIELSKGERGLREVINELSKVYGKENAFPEDKFFEIFAQRTYPEIADFFERYIINAGQLPLAEYYGKLGIEYFKEMNTGEEITSGGFTLLAPNLTLTFTQVDSVIEERFGLKKGDIFLAYNGTDVDLKNIGAVFHGFKDLEAGVPYELKIKRNGEEKILTCEKIKKEKIERHVLELRDDPTAEQLKLRQAWTGLRTES